MYLNLNCYKCDNVDCELCPLFSWIEDESLQGCTREVDEDLYAYYEHEINENLPFASLGQQIDFNKIDNLQNEIYHHKIGTLLDKKGKAVSQKRKIIDKLNLNFV